MARVNIFVSSTCYDLSQIRDDLKRCIIELGHNPILSELKDFPVDPMKSNSENCINAINNEADIFVLIIGDRYGSVLETGKSITNTEFIAALSKGIPIYTFSLKKMTTILPLWENNPNADYSNIVDNNKVFEFLSDVRKKRGLWNFEFERAQDITEILKAQLSNLFHDALIAKRAIENTEVNRLYGRISSKALDIIIKRKPAYELRFFMQSMKDEIAKYDDLNLDYNFYIKYKSSSSIENVLQFKKWASHKVRELQNIISSLGLLNQAFFSVWQDAEEPFEVEILYQISRMYARIYASLLEWGIEANSVIVPEEYSNIMRSFALIPRNIVEKIENYPDESLKKIDEWIVSQSDTEPKKKDIKLLDLNLNVDKDVVNQFYEECKKVFMTTHK